MSRKITPKSRESIQEAVDIVLNTHDDESAIEFLRETLEDDFPDLELGSMDLHEAIESLGGEQKKYGGNAKKAESLGKALSDFMKKQEDKKKPKARARTKRKRSKK